MSPNFPYHVCGASVRMSQLKFHKIFGVKSWSLQAIVQRWLPGDTSSRFDRIAACDRQTIDGQTHGNSIYRANIASCGKHCLVCAICSQVMKETPAFS